MRGGAPASCNVVVAFAGRTNVLTGTSCLVLWGEGEEEEGRKDGLLDLTLSQLAFFPRVHICENIITRAEARQKGGWIDSQEENGRRLLLH